MTIEMPLPCSEVAGGVHLVNRRLTQTFDYPLDLLIVADKVER